MADRPADLACATYDECASSHESKFVAGQSGQSQLHLQLIGAAFWREAECQITTQLSRSRRVLRTAGMGHEERFPPRRLSGGCGLESGPWPTHGYDQLNECEKAVMRVDDPKMADFMESVDRFKKALSSYSDAQRDAKRLPAQYERAR